MIQLWLGIFVFLFIMIPICAVGLPIFFVFCLLHPWLFIAIPIGIMLLAFIGDLFE